MDTKKVAFIICKNNLLWYKECIQYIHDLYVPEGYCIDIMSIDDAESIVMAYNMAMDHSDAKYKVYLYPDTFILNRDFILDILRIFEQDSSIGMIGMVGCRKFPDDVDHSQGLDAGRAIIYNGSNGRDLDLRECKDEEAGYISVESIDGFIIATQYDLQWQEGPLDEARPYDVLHSLNMRAFGKRVVIPWQKEPWCYQHQWPDSQIQTDRLYTQLTKIAEEGGYDVLWAIIDEIRSLKDKEISVIAALAEIYALEKASCQGATSIWWRSHVWKEIYDYYNWVRFVLLRMEYQREDERIDILKEMVEAGQIHMDAISHIAHTILPHTDHIYRTLLKKAWEEPLVSVILPVYNGADHVGKTIESILDQTYKNMELIIIDDASTDGSRNVISSYTDPRIKVILNEKNRNVVYSGNVGFEAARGKYVALIGHDDLWKQDKLEKQVAFLEEHPVYCACFTCMDVIDGESRIDRGSIFYRLFSESNRTAEACVRKLFMEGNFFCAPSACIKRSILEKVGYYKYALVQIQDYELWLRLFLEGEVYIYPERLTFYRRFENGKNLGVINDETRIRILHEEQYVYSSYIKALSKESFVRIFSGDMQNADAYGEKAILCEKAILLWKKGVYFWYHYFSELLEDEECRRILEENYGIDLNYFYRSNAQPINMR